MRIIHVWFILILLVVAPISIILTEKVIGSSETKEEFTIEDSVASFEGKMAQNLGGSVACLGDVNGDGFDDMAISGVSGNTACFVVLGNSSDLTCNRSSSDLSINFNVENKERRVGIVAGAGDVNGDGLNDILVSGVDCSDGGKTYCGYTCLVFGNRSGWGKDFNLRNSNASFWGEFQGDQSGFSVDGVGDVNGDGMDDFAVSAPFFDYNYVSGCYAYGKTYIFFGKEDGWHMGINLSQADASFIGDKGERSGYDISGLGDVNDDGYDDFLIGSPFYDPDPSDHDYGYGKTDLILGKADGWMKNCSLREAASASIFGNVSTQFMGIEIDGPGDLNGDGLNDILISSTNAKRTVNPNGTIEITHIGDRYVFFGRRSGWRTNMYPADADVTIPRTGIVTGVGDVNGDGLNDIMIGHMDWEYINETGISFFGWFGLYLFEGKRGTWDKILTIDKADAHFEKRWGRPYRIGDLDGDGFEDIVISFYDYDGKTYNEGRVYLVRYRFLPPDLHLKCTLSGDGRSINLTWNPAELENPISFELYRSFTGQNFELIAYLGPETGNYTDTDIWLYHNYYYFISFTAENSTGLTTNRTKIVHVFNGPDLDRDGTADLYDPDDDNDGFPDDGDMFPFDSLEWIDTDLDGIGNNADEDDDNDGIPDICDASELDPLNHISDLLKYINNTLDRDHKELVKILSGINLNISYLGESIHDLHLDILSVLNDLKYDLKEFNRSISEMIAQFRLEMESDSLSLDILMKNVNASLQMKLKGNENDMQSNFSQLISTMDQLNNLTSEMNCIRENLERLENLSESMVSNENNQNDTDNEHSWIIIMASIIAVLILALIIMIYLTMIGKKKESWGEM